MMLFSSAQSDEVGLSGLGVWQGGSDGPTLWSLLDTVMDCHSQCMPDKQIIYNQPQSLFPRCFRLFADSQKHVNLVSTTLD